MYTHKPKPWTLEITHILKTSTPKRKKVKPQILKGVTLFSPRRGSTGTAASPTPRMIEDGELDVIGASRSSWMDDDPAPHSPPTRRTHEAYNEAPWVLKK